MRFFKVFLRKSTIFLSKYFANSRINSTFAIAKSRLQFQAFELELLSNEISHSGIVDSISQGMVHVRILQSSACSSCKVSSYCTSAESKEKIIDVRCYDASRYSVGQNVTVMAAQSVGMKAVLLAFVIPSAILLAVIVAILQCGGRELNAALWGLASLIPYYIILYLMRSKLEKILTFYLKD